jgi:bifunctional non-homologous end joining protein LigD
MKRYPDGVAGTHFYEKDAPRFTPEWVQTFPVPRRSGGRDIRYIVVNDLPTLVWLANLASLELHPFLHCVPHLQRPTHVVFDLDPGEGSDILTCAKVALLLRDLLLGLKLKSFSKVSGSKGIQVYVPLNVPTSYEITRPFAKAVADLMRDRHRDLIVSKMAKVLRPGKVFIDWSQNSDFKTTVSVYSLRGKNLRPLISMPVQWDELEAALKSQTHEHLFFGPEDALRRLEKVGDLFEPVLKLRQSLPESIEKVARKKPRSAA